VSYCFYIEYLDRVICLEPEEFELWVDYSYDRIPYSEFIREATRILREKGVPRGRLFSVAMHILGLFEEGRYFIRLVVVGFDWTGRTEYCKRSGHDIVTECNVQGEFECLYGVFHAREDEIRDRLAEHLWEGYRRFLDEEYVLIRESSTSEGFNRFEVLRVIDKEDVTRLFFNISSAEFYRANECGGVLRRMGYYEDRLMRYMEDALAEFIEWLERECGLRE
jgi:hypothetical protein